MMASDINTKVVQPTLAAGALFDQHTYLTRLYTTISPQDMNKDPVFSYNATLPDVLNIHKGTLTYQCGLFGDRGVANTPATLRTEAGWIVSFPYGTSSPAVGANLPGAQRTEILREEGAPEVVTDNASLISETLNGSSGCAVIIGGRATQAAGGAFTFLFLGALAMLWRRRRA